MFGKDVYAIDETEYIKDLQEELNKLKKQVHDKEEEVNSITDQCIKYIDDLKKDYELKLAKSNDLNPVNNILYDENAKLKESHEQMQSEYLQVLEDKKKLVEQNARLNQKAYVKENKELKEKLSNLIVYKEGIEKKDKEILEEMEFLRSQNRDLTSIAEESKNILLNYNSLKNSDSILNKEYEELQNKLNEELNQKDLLEGSIEHLKEEILMIRKSKEDLKTEKENIIKAQEDILNNEISNLKSEIEELKKSQENLKQEKEKEINDQKENFAKEINNLTQEIEKLKKLQTEAINNGKIEVKEVKEINSEDSTEAKEETKKEIEEKEDEELELEFELEEDEEVEDLNNNEQDEKVEEFEKIEKEDSIEKSKDDLSNESQVENADKENASENQIEEAKTEDISNKIQEINEDLEKDEDLQELSEVVYKTKKNKKERKKEKTEKLKAKKALKEDNFNDLKSENDVDIKLPYKDYKDNTLVISETDEFVILPFDKMELEMQLKYEKLDETPEERMYEDYYVPLDELKNNVVCRSKELKALCDRSDDFNYFKKASTMMKYMFNSNVQTPIIAACIDIDSLNNYSKCLKKNELENFSEFNIDYKGYLNKSKKQNK